MQRTGESRGGAGTLAGLLVEFESVDTLLRGAERVRDAGYTKWDAYTPFPVHGLDDAMGVRYTKLPLFILACGVTGLVTGVVMQWWMNAVAYPYLISGKPTWSLPANVPVIFELTVLFTAIGTLVGLLAFNRMPTLNQPIFNSERFRRVTRDRFFIGIEAGDPKFDRQRTGALLQSLGGTAVEELEDLNP